MEPIRNSSFVDTLFRQLHLKRGNNWRETIFLNKRALFYVGLAVLAFLIFVPVFTYIYFAHAISSKQSLVNSNNTGLTLLDDQGQPFFTFNQPKAINYTTIDQIPNSVQKAAIAAEDKNFYSEPGFSISGIARAFLIDITSGRFAQGGSTIPQELVKNALLSSQRSILRKYQELVLAIEISRRYSKNDILEMYLNSVYFGEGAFGIQNAAQTYFSEDTNKLDLAQSAILIGLLPAPSALSPLSNDPNLAKAKQEHVLDAMVAQGYISQDQATAAKNEKITYHPNKATGNILAPHFALYVKDQLTQKYGEETVLRSGFKVKTTLNSTWQAYAEKVVTQQVAYLKYDHATNGSAVVLDPKTGQIKVMVGSEDWNNAQFGKTNMAITPRQPGSSFKPIVYGYALENHLITPATILDDTTHDFGGGYKPHDYDFKNRGPVTVRRALSNSLNIPAVEVMQKVGVNNTINFAQSLGITTLKDPSSYGLSMVLGAAEVPLLQMTNAYATYANYGEYNPTAAILEVDDKFGKVVEKYQPQAQNVVSEGTSFLISSILSDNKSRAEEFGNALTISRTAAVKTGTTSDFKDSLTIGYTPSITVGVWVGNNDDSPMDGVAGSLGAAPIWRLLMTDFLAETPIEKFRVPSDVVQKPVCPYGLLPTPTPLPANAPTPAGGTPTFFGTSYLEYFLIGTEPQNGCSLPTLPPKPSISPSTKPSQQPSPTNTPEPKATDTPQPEKPTLTPLPSPTSPAITIPITVAPSPT